MHIFFQRKKFQFISNSCFFIVLQKCFEDQRMAWGILGLIYLRPMLPSYRYQLVFTFSKSTVKTREQHLWNRFKFNNNDTRTTSVTSFWCRYCWLWTNFTHCSDVFIVDFELVNASKVGITELFVLYKSVYWSLYDGNIIFKWVNKFIYWGQKTTALFILLICFWLYLYWFRDLLWIFSRSL